MGISMKRCQRYGNWSRYNLIPGNGNANKEIDSTTHSLKTYSCLMVGSKQLDILHIKEQLGHKKIETTMRYSHLIDDRRHQATEKLNF